MQENIKRAICLVYEKSHLSCYCSTMLAIMFAVVFAIMIMTMITAERMEKDDS